MSERMLSHFRFRHLPEFLQAASRPFAELALQIVMMVPASAERTVALRKLVEAKDCAVRALLAMREGESPADPEITLREQLADAALAAQPIDGATTGDFK